MISSALYIVHILVCIAIVGLVLIQQGKGADAGAAFGSGASGTVFGAAGKGNFLEKLTRIFVAIFFITSLIMMFYKGSSEESVLTNVTTPVIEESTKQESNTLPTL